MDIVIDTATNTAAELAFRIENVTRFPQDDNKYDPYTSCFNTSNAVAIQYCLDIIGKTKADIGCSNENMQLEDYIYEVINSTEVTNWLKEQSGYLGNLISSKKRRIYFDVEAFVFNLLMNSLGFQANVKLDITFEELSIFIYNNKLPCIIGGNFLSVSKVEGHMNAVVGYNKVGINELIVHDPFGNALTGYTDKNGSYVSYGTRFYADKYGHLRTVLISVI
jgi:hypothetical protein